MNNAGAFLPYSRRKQVAVEFDGVRRSFLLAALKAKDREAAQSEAQRLHADAVSRLAEAAAALQTVYLLQEQELLVAAALAGEEESLRRKAALTPVADSPDCDSRFGAGLESLRQERRGELAAKTKEALAEKLVSLEINRRIQAAWTVALLDAALAQSLVGESGEKIYPSVEAMRADLPDEVLEKLYGALEEFLAERGSAQVFPEPHISNG